MRARKPVVVRSTHEQQSLRNRFAAGMTSLLRQVNPARWRFSGRVLVSPELVGSR